MPIVFQQPEPIRPDISTGYGAAEQWARDFPALQRQQEGIAQATLQGAALRQRAAQAGAALQQQSQMHAAALDQQSYLADQQQRLAIWQMAHQSDMQAQHAQLQDQLSANQLTRGEQMRLQRLQEARGVIQQQLASGNLTQDEANDALMQIQTGISPLQQRQQAFQRQVQQWQFRRMQTEAGYQDSLHQARMRHMNGTLGDSTSAFIDDNGDMRRVVRGWDGNVDHHATQLLFGWQYGGGEHAARGMGGAAGGGGSASETSPGGAGRNAPSGRQWHQLSHQEQLHIQELLTREMREEEGRTLATSTQEARPRAPWMNDTRLWDQEYRDRRNRFMDNLNYGRPQTTPGQTEAANEMLADQQAAREFNLNNREAFHGGRMTLQQLESGRAAHVAARRLERQRARIDAAAGTAATQAVGRQLVPVADADQITSLGQNAWRRLDEGEIARLPQAAREPARRLMEASSRAYAPDEVGRMPEASRATAGAFNGTRAILGQQGARDVRGRVLSDEQRRELMGDLNYAQQLLTLYGSAAAIPPQYRHLYDRAMTRSFSVQGPAAPPQQPARGVPRVFENAAPVSLGGL